MYSRRTAMIMAVLPHKDGAPNPNRHIHAGRAREWAMIMGVAYLDGPHPHDHGGRGCGMRAYLMTTNFSLAVVTGS